MPTKEKAHQQDADVKASPSSTSWWCSLSREEFSERAKRERERMETSTFGRGRKLITDATGVSR